MKKPLGHPKANAGLQRQFQERLGAYQQAGLPIVYLDESGFEYDMPRRYGYAPVGLRCTGIQEWHAKGRVNVIGALLGLQLLTMALFDGSINADVFLSWLVHDLLPQLASPTVIVMDKASFHKRADVRTTITQAGHLLEFLPPYSPQLNPIEHKWAQAKALRRKYHYSTFELFSRVSF